MFKSGASKKELEQLGNTSTIIAKSAVLDGNLETAGNLRIEGTLSGNIRCKAKVAMGDSSFVEGNILTQNAEIAGRVKGQLEVADLLILKSSAIIDGDIVAGKIMIETGAVFNGTCKMGATIKEINIEKEKSTEKRKPLNNYLRFSGFGFQMAATIGVFAWLGLKLDAYFGLKVPVFLIVLILSSIGGSLYIFIKQVTSGDNQG